MAERFITSELGAEELTGRGWEEAELARWRKNDPATLEIATRLRRESPFPIQVIAAPVQLGNTKSANVDLHRHMAAQASEPARHARRRAAARKRPRAPAQDYGPFVADERLNRAAPKPGE